MVVPLHGVVFSKMLKGLIRDADEGDSRLAAG